MIPVRDLCLTVNVASVYVRSQERLMAKNSGHWKYEYVLLTGIAVRIICRMRIRNAFVVGVRMRGEEADV